jgi:hypothetical protein
MVTAPGNITIQQWGYGLALGAYCGLIFYLSSQPVTLPGPSFPAKDKLLHFCGYALMALLAFKTLAPSLRSPRVAAIYAFLFTSLYGLSDEWHQSFVAGRHASIGDWLADSAGAAFTLIFLAGWRQTNATPHASKLERP